MDRQETQQQLDFTRGEQLRLLDQAMLKPPPIKHGKVSGMAMKGVLRAIDSFGRGKASWAGYETIAKAAGCSVRTAKKAIEALQVLSVIVVERKGIGGRGGSRNHVTIVWSELALLCDLPLERRRPRDADPHRRPRDGAFSDREDADGTSSESAHGTTESAPYASESAHGTTESAPCAPPTEARLKRQEPPPPPRAENRNGENERSWSEVVVVLRDELKIGKHGACIAACRERGETPAAVFGHVEHWRAAMADGRYEKKGALVWRLETGCWPAELAAVVDRRAAEEAGRRQQAKLEASLRAERLRAGLTVEGER